jgi:hypothetical protein
LSLQEKVIHFSLELNQEVLGVVLVERLVALRSHGL